MIEMTAATYGSRIKFEKQNHLLVSVKIFQNGNKASRLIIDTEQKRYKLVDPITGFVQVEGGEGINNLEILQRHAKNALKAYLGIRFEKENRKKNDQPVE